MARKSLDDILDGNDEPETEAVEAEAPAVEEQPEQQPRDEGGRFAEKGVEPEPQPEQAQEPEVEPPSTGKLPKDVYEPLKAVRSENQALKDQLEALRQEIQQNQQKAEQKPPEPAPDLWENTEGWQQHFGGQVVSQAVQQSAYSNKLNTSEFYARKNIDGFNDEWDGLNKWLTDNPAIAQQAAADYDPWGFAWRQYQNQRTIQELGATDVASLEEKLREKILADLQANAPVDPVKVPQSLSTKRSVGSRSGPAWSGPTPLGDLIGN